MTDARENQFDVVIVGGGPVGMGLAIELGQRRVSCAVVERNLQPSPIPKGQNLTQRTMEHFHVWGIEQALRAERTVPPDYGIGGLTCYGTLLSDYHYDWLQREVVRPYYLTDNERLPQYATEKVLRRRAAELACIEILYGVNAVDLTQDRDGVAVDVASEAGKRRILRGRYLVGCDGAHSLVRQKAGITQARSDHDRLMVLLVFRSTELHELLERYPGKSFYNVLDPELDGYWKFFGRVDLGSTWFFHAPVPPGTRADNFDFAAYLHAAVGAPFAVELEHIGFWDLRIATADSYRQGRVFIAGDAAHSHPPYGAFGINTGFEDARNLGWKLAAALRGAAAGGLLDSYDAERRPVFVSTARDFIEKAIEADRRFLNRYTPSVDRAAFEAAWWQRGSGAAGEVQSFEPNYEGSPIVFGPAGGVSSAAGAHSHKARAGHHLSPQPLSAGGNIYDRLGPDFSLIALGADPKDVTAFRAAAERAGMNLAVIEDSFAEGRERYDARLILVRPDHFVAWAGDRPDIGATEIVTRAVGMPAPGVSADAEARNLPTR